MKIIFGFLGFLHRRMQPIGKNFNGVIIPDKKTVVAALNFEKARRN